jgi:hypothetical protein
VGFFRAETPPQVVCLRPVVCSRPGQFRPVSSPVLQHCAHIAHVSTCLKRLSRTRTFAAPWDFLLLEIALFLPASGQGFRPYILCWPVCSRRRLRSSPSFVLTLLWTLQAREFPDFGFHRVAWEHFWLTYDLIYVGRDLFGDAHSCFLLSHLKISLEIDP